MPEDVMDNMHPGEIHIVGLGRDPMLRQPDQYDAPRLMADRGVVQFHVMAKPVGAACNLNCAYCFYLSKETLPNGPGAGRMSDEMLEMFIRQYIEGVTAPEVVFTWQGGEPTLLGIEFYRKVVGFQKQYAKPGQRIENDLQTNGTLLNEAWCEFLKEHRFLVGLSIDGPRKLHDQYRVSKQGRPTFDKVTAAAGLMRKFGVPFNTLTCVNRFNAKKPMDVYRFVRDDLGSMRMQFTPVVEFRGFDRGSLFTQQGLAPMLHDPEARPGHPNSIVTDWPVDPEDWGYFLCRLFDRWISRDVGKIFINQFETLVAQHLGEPSQICVYSEFCGKGVALEHDGSLYACDHFVYPDYNIGDLRNGQLRDVVLGRQQVQFGYAKNESLPKYCRQCPYLSDCWGECPKNRLLRAEGDEPNLNYLCSGLKAFFAHAIPHINQIVAGLRR